MSDTKVPETRKKKIRWLLWFRRWHLYLGCFFTPMLMFYLVTGAYQTVNEDRIKEPGEAQTFWQKARVVHTDSILPPKPADNSAVKELEALIASGASAEEVQAFVRENGLAGGEANEASRSRPWTYKWLSILMCLLAGATIALGLVLSFKTIKQKWLVVAVLVAGSLLPWIMLKIGQGGL